uniref:RING-type domain-containing protein n=1 Tax=Caenorhabditis tropicalis TaxID=1561998 RepID=A0A1I7TRI2_9PELO
MPSKSKTGREKRQANRIESTDMAAMARELNKIQKDVKKLEKNSKDQNETLKALQKNLTKRTKIDKIIGTCKSCSKKFNLNDRSPRIIACGHTSCQSCLLNKSEIDESDITKKWFKCPECIYSTRLPYERTKDGLPSKNWTIMNHIQN